MSELFVHAGIQAGAISDDLLTLAHDCVSNVSLIVKEPLLDTFHNLFALKLKPQILHKHSLPVTLSINVETKSGVNHILIDNSDLRGKDILITELCLVSHFIDLTSHPEDIPHIKLDTEH